MPRFVKRIELGFGEKPGGAGLRFEPAGLTVLVGPNNSGKTTVLRGVAAIAVGNPPSEIVRAIERVMPKDPAELEGWLRPCASEFLSGTPGRAGLRWHRQTEGDRDVHRPAGRLRQGAPIGASGI